MADETTMVIGPIGGGKSHFISTMETPGLVFDLDNKWLDLPPDKREGWDRIAIIDPPMISSLQMRSVPKKDTVAITEPMDVPAGERPTGYKNFLIQFTKAFHRQSEEETHYKTVAVDTWTSLNEMTSRSLTFLDGHPGEQPTYQEYGALKAKFIELLSMMTSFPCAHFVLAAHEDVSMDPKTEKLFYSPYSWGQKIRPIMGKWFSNILRTFTMEGKEKARYCVATRAHELFTIGKTKHWLLPTLCEANWGEMMALQKRREDEESD